MLSIHTYHKQRYGFLFEYYYCVVLFSFIVLYSFSIKCSCSRRGVGADTPGERCYLLIYKIGAQKLGNASFPDCLINVTLLCSGTTTSEFRGQFILLAYSIFGSCAKQFRARQIASASGSAVFFCYEITFSLGTGLRPYILHRAVSSHRDHV